MGQCRLRQTYSLLLLKQSNSLVTFCMYCLCIPRKLLITFSKYSHSKFSEFVLIWKEDDWTQIILINIFLYILYYIFYTWLPAVYGDSDRSHWPLGLRRRFAAFHLLRLGVRNTPVAWMSVCCDCCVLSGTGLCDELITRPEESYRLWRVVVFDLETSRTTRPWPALGRSATGEYGLLWSVHFTSGLVQCYVFTKYDLCVHFLKMAACVGPKQVAVTPIVLR